MYALVLPHTSGSPITEIVYGKLHPRYKRGGGETRAPIKHRMPIHKLLAAGDKEALARAFPETMKKYMK